MNIRSTLAGLALLASSVPATAAMIDEGSQFPAWKLLDQDGAVVASNDLQGKAYLLWFYPAAMTPGCTAEGRGLRDRSESFKKAEIEILGVSFDPPEKNKQFVEAESFPFRLLSDREKTLALAVGAAESSDQGYARRISYLVGPDGKVLAAYDSVNPVEHAAEVLEDYRDRATRDTSR